LQLGKTTSVGISKNYLMAKETVEKKMMKQEDLCFFSIFSPAARCSPPPAMV